jgi:hypothetical protein
VKGYKLVPVEPTDDMVIAFAETWYSKCQAYDDPDMLDAYRDMLAAAPAPPQPIYDEAKERQLFEASLGSTLASLNTKGDYVYVSSRHKWEGWKACAQSRAKAGEVGHE